MKLKRILALAVSLAMVLSIVPAFEITAGAAGSSYSIEFELVDIGSSHRDLGITDANGKVFTGFCLAAAGDGFYAFDGERSFNGDDATKPLPNGATAGTTTSVGGKDNGTGITYSTGDKVTVTVTNNAEGTGYTVVYAIGDTYRQTREYTGATVNGISSPDKWGYGTRYTDNQNVTASNIYNSLKKTVIYDSNGVAGWQQMGAAYDFTVVNSTTLDSTMFSNASGGNKRDGYAVFTLPDSLMTESEIQAELTVTVQEPVGQINDGTVSVLYYMSDTLPDSSTATNYFRSAVTYTTSEATMSVPASIAAGNVLSTGKFTVNPAGKKYLIVCLPQPTSGGNAGSKYYRYTETNGEYLTVSTKAGVTVNYVDTDDGTVAGSYTTQNYVGTTFAPSITASYYASETTGYLYSVGAAPEAINVTAGGNTVTIPVTKFKQLVKATDATTYNYVQNGDFETGEFATSYSGEAFASTSNFAIADGNNGPGSNVLKHVGPSSANSRVLSGIGGERSFQKLVSGVTSGNSYFYSIDVYQNGTNGFWANYSFTDGGRLATNGSSTWDNTLKGTAYITDGCQSVIGTDSSGTMVEIGDGKSTFNYANQWHTYSGLVTAPEGAQAFEFDLYYFCDNVGSLVDNVQFYQIKDLQTSNLATVQEALKGLTVPTMAKSSIDLPKAANDGAQDITVTWADPDNTGIIDTATGTVTPPSNVTTVTLVPTGTTADGSITATGEARTVTVFPQALTGTYKDTDGSYDIGTVNLIGDNWDFSQGLSVWNDGENAVINSKGFEAVTDGDVNYVKVVNYSSQTSGGGSPQALKRDITGLTAGKKYLIAVTTAAGLSGSFAKVNYGSDEVSLFSDTTGWTRQTAVFTAAATTLNIAFRWSNTSYESFELYELTKLEENITGITDEFKNITATIISGNTPKLPSKVNVTTDLGNKLSVDVDWKYSEADLTTASNGTTVHGLIAGYDAGIDAQVTVLAESFSIPAMQSYNSTPGNVFKFPVSIKDEFYIEFDLTVNQIKDSSVQIGAGGKLFGDGQIGIGTNGKLNLTGGDGAGASDAAELVNPISAGDTFRILVKADASTDSVTVTATKSDGSTVSATKNFRTNADYINSIVLLTNGGGAEGDIAASGIRVSAASHTVKKYTVEYKSTDGVINETNNNLTYIDGEQYGYSTNVVFPNVEIPYYPGHIFRTKAVSGSDSAGWTVTLNYEPTSSNSFFKGHTDNNATFVSLNMLGAHDAFTQNVGKNDAAAIVRAEQYADNAARAYAVSKTQDVDAYALLESGVRYFDVRLSRSDETCGRDDHTHGVFYTTHNTLSDEFASIAYTIAQWAQEHKGEIIVLDFQEIWDGTLEGTGIDSSNKCAKTAATHRSLDKLLEDTGIKALVTIGNASIKGHTYGTLTDNGNKSNIVLFGRAESSGVGNFIYRGNTYHPFAGYMYSNYDKGVSISTGSVSASYIQGQVDVLDQYNTGYTYTQDGVEQTYKDENGDHPIYHMFRVMQAQSELNVGQIIAAAFGSTQLISNAKTDNQQLYTWLTSTDYSSWLTSLPVIMVNGANYNTNDLVTLLQKCNEKKTTTVEYVDESGASVGSAEEPLMIGTLFTKTKNTLARVNGKLYTLTKDYTTKPSSSTDGTVIPIPYNGTIKNIQVNGTPFEENIYTVRDGVLYSALSGTAGSDPNNPAFAAYTWDYNSERVGIAVLNADADRSWYSLEAEIEDNRFNKEVTPENPDARYVKFYAISMEEYNALNVGSKEDLLALMTEDNLVQKITDTDKLTDEGKSLLGATTIALDAEKIKAKLGANSQVVIIGDAGGGLYGLKGSSMNIASGYTVTIGTDTTYVKAGEAFEKEAVADVVAYTDESGKIHLTSAEEASYGKLTIGNVTSDMTLTPLNLGVSLVDGAQVRVGQGVYDYNGLGYKVTIDGTGSTEPTLAASGLRFIGLVDAVGLASYKATDSSITVGIEIAAKNADGTYTAAVDIPADRFQDPGTDKVFTAAIVNLNEGNYNRIFKATPYVMANGAKYYGDSVLRSVYEIAAGILVTQTVDGSTDVPVDVTERVNRVLNAYVNQVGIRLELTGDTTAPIGVRSSGNTGAYQGGKDGGPTIFFDVTSSKIDDTTYEATITTTSKNAAQIFGYWNEYIRLNNQKLADYIVTDGTTLSEDGKTLTLKISTAKQTAAAAE